MANSLIELDRAHRVRGEPGRAAAFLCLPQRMGIRGAQRFLPMTMLPSGRPEGRLGV
jgi:hypothetical protein